MPSINIAAAVTNSERANDNLAEVDGCSLHTATTEMVLQASTEATIRNTAATPSVNVSVSALGTKKVLAAVSPESETQATIAAIPAIRAKRAGRGCLIN